MKRNDLGYILIALVVFLAGIGIYLAQAQKPVENAIKGVQEQLDPNELFAMVNAERSKAGIPALVKDARLETSAKNKCEDMVKDHYFSHQDENGQIWNFIKEQMTYKSAAENLGISNQDDNSVIVSAWLNSESHRENLLNPNLQLTGIYVCGDNKFEISGNKGNDLVVQHFASQ